MGLFSMAPQAMIFTLFARILVLFTTMPVHEYAHALVAEKLGDETALYQGRIDFNPIRHLDLFGTVLLLLTGFGWAKPVPVNPRNFNRRVTMRGGMALTSLAGPVSNILLAFVLMLLFKLLALFGGGSGPLSIVAGLLYLMVTINISLAVFNLLPIPPLDGYNILVYFIPAKWEYTLMQYRQQITMLLFLLVFTGVLSGPLSWLSMMIFRGLDFLTGFVDLLGGMI